MTAPHGVAPSILAADFARLGAQVEAVMDAGARTIHVDVMDGHFVPPITMGTLAVDALAEQVHGAGGILDVHLMVERPERHIADFAKAGADNITIHAEATPHLHYVVQAIHEAGCTAGLALCPATPVLVASDLITDLDVLLVMTVNPGWGGQAFIPQMLEKVRALRARLGADAVIEVDGGIDPDTARTCVQAGATWLVAGSAIFGAENPAHAYNQIAAAAEWG